MRAAEDNGVDRDLEIRRSFSKRYAESCSPRRMPCSTNSIRPLHGMGMISACCSYCARSAWNFCSFDGHGRRHDEDTAAWMPLDRGLERRLRADDGHVRKFGAQCIGRGGSRGVAGDDDGLCAFVQQVLHDRAAARRHLVHGLHAVGRVERVAIVEIVFLRQQTNRLPQDTDPPRPESKNAMGLRSAISCLLGQKYKAAPHDSVIVWCCHKFYFTTFSSKRKGKRRAPLSAAFPVDIRPFFGL